MNFYVQADFVPGKIAGDAVDISTVIEQLNRQTKRIGCWPINQILDVFNDFSEKLLEPSNELHQKYPNAGIPFIANWCKRSNLESILNSSFKAIKFIDGFTVDTAQKMKSYHAVPRGVVVHWMAGNVPTLGFISLIQGLLTKNVNLVKVASDTNFLLADLLTQLKCIKTQDQYSGKELVKACSVIRYDHKDVHISKMISKNADVRIIWGGNDSIRAIKSIETKMTTTDLVYPHRTSLMLVAKDILLNSDVDHLARRAATDISVFEQKACASPHTIFLETTNDNQLAWFGEKLKKGLEMALKSIPKLRPNQHEINTILKMRAKYDMFYQAFYSDGIEFTILIDDLFQLGPAIGNRTIYLRKVDNLNKIANLITPEVQSIGIAAPPQRYEELTTCLCHHGVIRFTRIGAMTHFEIPWDGFYIPQHLVYWASRTNPH